MIQIRAVSSTFLMLILLSKVQSMAMGQIIEEVDGEYQVTQIKTCVNVLSLDQCTKATEDRGLPVIRLSVVNEPNVTFCLEDRSRVLGHGEKTCYRTLPLIEKTDIDRTTRRVVRSESTLSVHNKGVDFHKYRTEELYQRATGSLVFKHKKEATLKFSKSDQVYTLEDSASQDMPWDVKTVLKLKRVK